MNVKCICGFEFYNLVFLLDFGGGGWEDFKHLYVYLDNSLSPSTNEHEIFSY